MCSRQACATSAVVACVAVSLPWFFQTHAKENIVVHPSRCGSPPKIVCKPDPDIADLSEVGYAVLRAFLSPEETAELHDLYLKVRAGGIAMNEDQTRAAAFGDWYGGNLWSPVDQFPASVRLKLEALMETIQNKSRVRVDMLQHALWHAVEGGQFTPSENMHCDTDSYILAPNQYDYLHMQMPVIKPRVDEGNLRLIPSNAMQECAPPMLHKSVYTGCGGNWRQRRDLAMDNQTFRWPMFRSLPRDVQTVFVDDYNFGHRTYIDFSVDDISCSLHVGLGDLLIFRGDIVHKTDVFTASRVTFDARAAWGADKISLNSILNDGGLGKFRILSAHYYEPFASLYGLARAWGQDSITLRQAVQAGVPYGCVDGLGCGHQVVASWLATYYRGLFQFKLLRMTLEQKLFPRAR